MLSEPETSSKCSTTAGGHDHERELNWPQFLQIVTHSFETLPQDEQTQVFGALALEARVNHK